MSIVSVTVPNTTNIDKALAKGLADVLSKSLSLNNDHFNKSNPVDIYNNYYNINSSEQPLEYRIYENQIKLDKLKQIDSSDTSGTIYIIDNLLFDLGIKGYITCTPGDLTKLQKIKPLKFQNKDDEVEHKLIIEKLEDTNNVYIIKDMSSPMLQNILDTLDSTSRVYEKINQLYTFTYACNDDNDVIIPRVTF